MDACPICDGPLVDGVDQFQDSSICPKCQRSWPNGPNNDPEWMRKRAEAEDGCIVSVGGLVTDLERRPVFTELNPPERKRTYVYRDGSELTIENVTRICVRPSGSNRLETADGAKWVVLEGFIAVRLEVDSWTF